MNLSVQKPERATSPRMLGASALIHGLLILALIAASTAAVNQPKPPEPLITTVGLVAPPGPPAPVVLQPGATKEPQTVAPEPLETASARDEAGPPERRTLNTATLASKPVKRIPLKKRDRKIRRVAEVPEEERKKPQPKEREDPEDYLKKKLAALKEKLDTRKPSMPGPPGPDDSKLTDEQLARWYGGMRDKISAHWSVFQETSVVDRVTEVGIQIADNGQLLHAGVDKSSGDPVFDRSAMRAVHQAAPFPPVPPDVRERIRQAGGLALRFTPGGIQ
ncbi:MAG: TonB family protein [Pseudomonadota bacterium]